MSPNKWLRITSIMAIISMLVAPFQGSVALAASTPLSTSENQAAASTVSDNTPAVYMVQFAGAPASLYAGDVAGFAATSPLTTGAHKLNVYDATVSAYRTYLAQERSQILSAIESVVGSKPEVLYTYDLAYHGAAVKLTPAQAAAVGKLPGVLQIEREKIYQLDSDVGPAFMNADEIWSGAATGNATKGEGIVVGVIDTGINADHPSFADVGGDGYDHTNPLGSGNYIGWCNPGFPVQVTCNDKLIGVWGYVSNGGNPEDTNGHGSHTASTAAGNVVLSATVDGANAIITRTVSGVAPHANIIAYAACCAGSALQAAIEQIITDSVDVVNYSIGPTSGESNPYTDSNMQGFLGATAAGIFVSVSAGNSGPGASTTGNTAPWVQITAASEHNRSVANSLINMNGTLGSPPANIEGKGFNGSLGATEIVYAGAYNDPLCLNSFAVTPTVAGKIVVCDRGVNGRVAKSANVAAGGAAGFVLANNAPSAATLNGEGYAVPGLHISYADGIVLKAWLAGGGVYTASIAGFSVNTNSPFADNMASFSSRGPSIHVPDTIVPSLSAPGVDVLAAYADGTVPTDPEFIMISGTSMASPHAAGAAALMRALYPSWTPAQIKSALMMASQTNMRKENATTPATPFDRGSGRIMVDGAANVGFVLNETAARFAAANPSTGGQPGTLNLASVAENVCIGVCTWTRVIRSVWPSVVTYTTSFSTSANISATVTPATIVLNPGQVQTITISADVSAITSTTTWNLGDLNFWPEVGPVVTTMGTTYTSNPSLAIPDNTSVTSTLSVADAATLLDVNVVLSATHTWVGGLEVKLTSPNATTVMLVDEPNNGTGGCSGNDFRSIVLNDDPGGVPGTLVQTVCVSGANPAQAYAAGGSYTPATPLTAFDSGTLTGDWHLNITDLATGDPGVLQSWSLVVVTDTQTLTGTPPAMVHFPLAVKAGTGSAPTAVDITAYSNTGTYTMTGLLAGTVTALQTGEFGLTKATVTTQSLNEDPTPNSVYDNINDGTVFYITTTVAAGDRRLVAEIVASTSADIDLYVGRDLDGDGPEASEELIFSATGAVLEYVNINNPTAGTYWILVQNWGAGANPPDPTSLATAVVPNTASTNLDVIGPATPAAGVPFTVTLNWNEPSMAAVEYWYGGVDFGTDVGNPANIGSTRIDLTRTSLPEIATSPSELDGTQLTNQVVTHTLTIENLGAQNLTWNIQEWSSSVTPNASTPAFTTNAAALAETVDTVVENLAGPYVPSNVPTTYTPDAPTVVLYNNGPLVNAPGGGANGADGSLVQNVVTGGWPITMTTLGQSHAWVGTSVNRVADDFTIPGPNGWNISSIRFYAYQTGGITATSSFTGANLRIWSGTPGAGSVVFGDTTTNRLAATSWSGIYRAAVSAPTGATRPIMSNTVIVSTTLPPGTYWLDWQSGGTIASGPWAPPITINGVLTTGNGLFSSSSGASWVAFNDGNSLTQQGLPFIIEGAEVAIGGCGTSIPWASVTPANGTTPGFGSSNVSVVYNSTGLAVGVYTGTLCVNSNDADEAQVLVPLTLTVAPAVTFVYHDVEDVVGISDTLHLSGAFNGWPGAGPMLTADTGNTVFSITVPITAGASYGYKYQVNSGGVNWDMVNTNDRTITVTTDVTVDDYRNVVVDYAVLDRPPTMTVWLNQMSANVYGRVHVQNVTNAPGGAGRGLKAEVGYGTGTDLNTWTWVPMTYNTEASNNDEYMGAFTLTATGTYSYAVRFDGNAGAGNPNAGWTYGDTDGVFPSEPFEFENTGWLSVLARLFLPLISK